MTGLAQFARYMIKPFVSLSFIVLILAGCISSSSSNNNTNSSGDINNIPDDVGSEQLTSIVDILADQGLTVVESATHDGHTGYLAQYNDSWSKGTNNKGDTVEHPGKYCMVLSGPAYSMGYQSAFLKPEAVRIMTTTFLREAVFAQFKSIGIEIASQGAFADALFDILYKNILKMCKDGASDIPAFITDEMEGITHGAAEAGQEVNYWEVFALSQGIDALFTFLGRIIFDTSDLSEDVINDFNELLKNYPEGRDNIIITPDNKIKFPKMKKLPFPEFGCNGFVISDDATSDGKTFHGRDFMFTTGGVYQDLACTMVYLPEEGDGYPFVSISVPGFVGQMVGINSQGLSFGVDISLGNSFGFEPGMGCLTIGRILLQQHSNLTSAVTHFKEFDRGSPWIFILADDESHSEYGHGVVLEVGRSHPPFDGPDLLADWQQWFLSGLPVTIGEKTFELNPARNIIGELNDELPELPDRGTMIRSSKWIFPEKFKEFNTTIPVPNPFWKDLGYWDIMVSFPDQIEKKDDILAVTNHFILPRMRFTQFHPIVLIGYGLGPLPESVWRYETMLDLILSDYGDINFYGQDDSHFPSEGSAGWIIDFLNTQRSSFYTDKGVPPDGEIEGHHVVMNNTDKEIKGLYGYMNDPWVGFKLMPLVDFWYP